MKEKIARMRDYVITHNVVVILILITIWGGFLRFYGGDELIFFEIDQARDYVIFDEVVHGGFGTFPLLGPKAGGTFFRLGPVYYVPTYFLTQILGVSPYVMLLPEIICAILTIPLLFFFLREFFDEKISLYCTALFASSLFFVEYAHFAWNPNYIPFFFLLLLYALLRYMQKTQLQFLWTIVSAMAAGIVMQLHTITFVATPLIVLLYCSVLYKRILWKHSIVFVSIVFLLSAPLMMNDMLTKGENIREFFVAKDKREVKSEDSSFGKIMFVNVYNHVRQYTVIVTSQNIVRDLARLRSSNDLEELVQHNTTTIKEKVHLFGIVVLGCSLLLFYGIIVRDTIKVKRSDLPSRYHFLLLIVIVQGVLMALFIPLALAADSRHFLPIFFAPFVAIGYLLTWMNRQKRYVKYAAMVACVIFLLSNIWGTARWLHMVNNFEVMNDNAGEFILESYYTMTMRQWRQIADQIIARSEGHDVIYVQSSTYHIRPLIALLRIAYGRDVRTIEQGYADPRGAFFVLKETEDVKKDKPLVQEIEDQYVILQAYDHGTMTLFELGVQVSSEFVTQGESDEEIVSDVPCYDLQYDVSQRDRCRVRDLPHLLHNWR